jgi:hypothetical protein
MRRAALGQLSELGLSLESCPRSPNRQSKQKGFTMKKTTISNPIFSVVEGPATAIPEHMHVASVKHWDFLQKKGKITRGDLVEMAKANEGWASTMAWNTLILIRMTAQEAAEMQNAAIQARCDFAFQHGAMHFNKEFFIEVLQRCPLKVDRDAWASLIGMEHSVEDVMQVIVNCGKSMEAKALVDKACAYVLETFPKHRGALMTVLQLARDEDQRDVARKLFRALPTAQKKMTEKA